MKKLQRLLFLQGKKCFFSGHPVPDGEASVEHLDALSKGGKNSDENSVVCCKAVNAVLGNLSVKEKFRAVLSHEGAFACPMRAAPAQEPQLRKVTASDAESLLPAVLENLRKRGAVRPKKAATLRKSVAASFPQTSPELIEDVLILLKERGYTTEDGGAVSYPGFRLET
jgi:hypothetical protein